MNVPASRQASSTRRIGWTAPRNSENVVSERFTESARLDEIALHVDDDERRRARFQFELIWFRAHASHASTRYDDDRLLVDVHSAHTRGSVFCAVRQ
jgi:hypothetical protein